jgi:Fe-S-cluster containining protein
MSKTQVVRPVWRKFHDRFLARAADWVKSGGHALVYSDKGELRMLLGVDDDGKLTEFALWSLLAVEQRAAKTVERGPARGLRIARVQSHAEWAVVDWCERDSAYEAPTRVLHLDCLECAACCHEASVLLDESDLDRFREAGRADLVSRKFIKRSRDGKVHLRFEKGGKCQHLLSDRKCAIYEIRPFNCSVFPAGSEACLAARESTNQWRDGVPLSE